MNNDALVSRLKTAAFMLKFGHDLFEAPDMAAAAAAAVNDSRSILNFRTAAIFELTDSGRAVLLGQFAQTECNPHSAQAQHFKTLAEKAEFNDRGIWVTSAERGEILCCRLNAPGETGIRFVWILEYENAIPENMENTVRLLGKSVAEALAYARISRQGSWQKRRRFRKIWKYAAIMILLTAAMFIPVPESTNAEFTLQAAQNTAAYAWFDGPIARCIRQDGEMVRKGEVVAVYDTAQLEYKLANARSALQEIEAELELEQQNAFTDESKLGKAKLLKARREVMLVAVKEAQWFLEHAQITAPADGILVLSDGKAEQLAGKAVRTGDKLFEIHSTGKLIAQIMVPEQESSVLQQQFRAELFLYTRPEKAIAAQVTEIAAYPEATPQNIYCYPVKADLEAAGDQFADMRIGMRGTAKLYGQRVRLGYYLFKNVILYFRKF